MHLCSNGVGATRKTIMVLLLAVFQLPAIISVHAEQLKLAVSLTLPPFIFAESDSGIDLEIAKEALSLKGYAVKPVYVVFGRTAVDLKAGKVDGALTVNKERGLENVFLSDQYICYQNVAVSLKSRGFQIGSVKDLVDKKIVAFQDAAKILGPDFASAAEASPSYYEIPDQENQVALLFKNRTDVVVMDVNIFKYYQQNTERTDIRQEVDIFTIFPPSCYSAGFRSEKVRDDFNEGLKELRASGRYDEIFRKYVN